MKNMFVSIFVIFIVKINISHSTLCGCKTTRKCYLEMVNALKDVDEESCVEDASIGSSTIFIYLKALKEFCPDLIKVVEDERTYEDRVLYEVVLSVANDNDDKNEKVVVLEAGQQAGSDSTGFALYIIEQLAACEDYNDMLKKVKWVILPCSNPDGVEYARFNRFNWIKNMKPSDDQFSTGVDISRNFDYQWGSCEQDEVGFSQHYPGKSAASENETQFIKKVLDKYKKDLKLYLSIRRDGHSILYPYAYSNTAAPNNNYLVKVAADVAAKVNIRAGGVQLFLNQSIFERNGKAHCGHSVDYAFSIGVPLAYEMRVFLGQDSRIVSKFQQLPRGYDSSLRLGYFSGIREMYNAIVDSGKKG